MYGVKSVKLNSNIILTWWVYAISMGAFSIEWNMMGVVEEEMITRWLFYFITSVDHRYNYNFWGWGVAPLAKL